MPPSPERGLRESVLQMLTVLHLVFATKRLCSRGSFVVPFFLRFDRLFLLWLKADADAAGGVNALHETVQYTLFSSGFRHTLSLSLSLDLLFGLGLPPLSGRAL